MIGRWEGGLAGQRSQDMKRLIIGVTAALGLGLGSAQAQAVKADPSIAAYQKVSGVSGNINSVGSDTMNNLMTFWPRRSRRRTRT